jgi:NTE family protein
MPDPQTNGMPLASRDFELLPEERPGDVEEGVALCLSGGGYRAMLFHLGTLMYLNSQGLLPKLDRISSVSGGSITAGVLGHRWSRLQFAGDKATNFDGEVVATVKKLASKTIDQGSILSGILLPGTTVGDRVIAAYDKHLFGGATLQDLPDRPRFVINATNVQSGTLFRFSKPFIWDYRVGKIAAPRRKLSEAVAASSAFPPVLSPVRLRFDESDFVKGTGDDLQRKPFTTHVVLSDGGVYDNMGIETAWKRYRTVLISDAGAKTAPDPSPASDWARHGLRINSLIDNQVRSLRKRQVVSSFVAKTREGAYWSIRGDISQYRAPGTLVCSFEATSKLAATPTRLKELPEETQNQIINWGFALADAAVRAFVYRDLPPPADFPLPGGVGVAR